jgi:large repetitive protein
MRVVRCLLVLTLSFVVACGDNSSKKDPDPTGPQCADGIDNDGDGDIDFPDDLGCESAADDSEDSAPLAKCSDNRDNDGDGKIDYPNDPGCVAPLDDDEEDDCPTGPDCPQCGNGIDDNGDGTIDYPADPGCTSASDPTEFLEDPVACGPGMMIKGLPVTGMDTGMLDGTSTSSLPSTCGGGVGSAAVAYLFHLARPAVIVATTDLGATTVDTVLELRGVDCDDPRSAIACNNDTGTGSASTITTSLPAGSYYLIVQGNGIGVTGPYALMVQFFAGEGSMCTATSDCGPGLVCRVPVNASQMICTKPVCSDGLDDDGDGKIDFPNDPGCTDPADDSEDDDCPSGPMCPECGDGIDNDGDGDIDFPADVSCASASSTSESCAGELDPIEALVAPTTFSTLVGATDEHDPSCGGNGGPDRMFTLTIPQLESLVIDTNGSSFDTVLSLLDSTCQEPSLACDDDGGEGTRSLISRTNVAAGQYVVAVDAFSNFTTVGAFQVNIRGTISAGESCESALAQSGALICAPTTACKGPVGSRTCAPAECNDGIDNNGDGRIDFPNDPGCVSTSDDSEDTVCPGPLCPACSDGIDNDGDGLIDFPADPSCLAASGTTESCVQSEPIAIITQQVTTGTTIGQVNDFTPACGTTGTHTAPDVAVQLDLPAMQSLRLNVTGFDTVHALLDASCAGLPLACSDPATMVVGSVPAGTYFLVIDGFSSGSGNWTLNTTGVIAAGGSCESPLFQAGAFTCPTGLTCQGPVGNRTCFSECADGVDNDGDGLIDYPFDPGCSSPADPIEDAVACPGAGCPVCSNEDDDDGDGLVDFPADFGCGAASSASEVLCPIETQPTSLITQPQTAGTLAAPATDNYEQSCQGNTGNDLAFGLQLPVPVQKLVIDTIGSTISDTVLSMWDASCSIELGCDDDGGPGRQAQLVFAGVPAGNYAIQVDSFGSGNNGAFVLNVRGTVAPGTACTAPLFSTGVLVCPAGTTCSQGTCQ